MIDNNRTFAPEIEMARERCIKIGEGLVIPISGGRVMITRLSTDSWRAELFSLPEEHEHYP